MSSDSFPMVARKHTDSRDRRESEMPAAGTASIDEIGFGEDWFWPVAGATAVAAVDMSGEARWRRPIDDCGCELPAARLLRLRNHLTDVPMSGIPIRMVTIAASVSSKVVVTSVRIKAAFVALFEPQHRLERQSFETSSKPMVFRRRWQSEHIAARNRAIAPAHHRPPVVCQRNDGCNPLPGGHR